MYDTSHYTALMTRLSNEKQRLALATNKSEIELRSVWVSHIQKEIQDEIEFLKTKGVDIYQVMDVNKLTDDELLSELFGE